MEASFLLLAAVALGWGLSHRDQAARIAFLAQHLSRFQIERHMQNLTQGYLRVLAEEDPERRRQGWDSFAGSENAVAGQIENLAQAMSKEPTERTRMGRWLFHVPYVERLGPGASRDFRELLRLHAEGVRRTVDNTAGLGRKDRAFQLSAELLLFQHSCHWFCKSRAVADTRLAAAHRVTCQKVLESVSDDTLRDYKRWLQA